jgi:CubicO group peptidase (beta-lactamase class C family)
MTSPTSVEELGDRLFSDPTVVGETFQLLAIHKGTIVYETNAAGKDSSSTSVSWSMAKSWTHALVGHAILNNILPPNIHSPVHLYWSRCPSEWNAKTQNDGGADGIDPRSSITMHHLLTMQSGLDWREEYIDGNSSDVIPMLNEIDDMANFAASKTSIAGCLGLYLHLFHRLWCLSN